jgi:hypothetical protein
MPLAQASNICVTAKQPAQTQKSDNGMRRNKPAETTGWFITSHVSNSHRGVK